MLKPMISDGFHCESVNTGRIQMEMLIKVSGKILQPYDHL